MQKLLTYCRGLSLRLSLVLLALTFGVSGCSQLSPLGALTGSGTNVAANTQLGQTNTQTLGTTSNSSNTFKVAKAEKVEVSTLDQSSGDSQVETEAVENINIDNGDSVWLWLAFVVAVLVDSPARWPSQIYKGISRWRRRKDN